MTTSQNDLEQLTNQVARLQRQVALLKRSGMMIIGVVLAVFVFGQAAPVLSQPAGNRVVEAEKFVLKDSKGRVRGEWEVEDFPAIEGNRVILRLRNSEGKVAAVLQNPSWGSAELLLLDKKTSQDTIARMMEYLALKKEQLVVQEALKWPVQVDESGTGSNIYDEPYTQLDANSLYITGKERQSLSLEILEEPSIKLHSGESRASVTADQLGLISANGGATLDTVSHPGLMLFSNDGKRDAMFSLWEESFLLAIKEGDQLRARWDVGKNFNSIALFDDGGRKRAVLGSTDLSNVATGESRSRKESSLVLFGEDGKTVFTAP